MFWCRRSRPVRGICSEVGKLNLPSVCWSLAVVRPRVPRSRLPWNNCSVKFIQLRKSVFRKNRHSQRFMSWAEWKWCCELCVCSLDSSASWSSLERLGSPGTQERGLKCKCSSICALEVKLLHLLGQLGDSRLLCPVEMGQWLPGFLFCALDFELGHQKCFTGRGEVCFPCCFYSR